MSVLRGGKGREGMSSGHVLLYQTSAQCGGSITEGSALCTSTPY